MDIKAVKGLLDILVISGVSANTMKLFRRGGGNSNIIEIVGGLIFSLAAGGLAANKLNELIDAATNPTAEDEENEAAEERKAQVRANELLKKTIETRYDIFVDECGSKYFVGDDGKLRKLEEVDHA